ncbi:MAG: D-alanyl-D-alanine carboxypeptidase [Lachnospiraceae bacterium]|nr:D-alanyl-D-alanine carboxypeptidase [Lachnospiraceae bacterium]
MKKKIAIEIVIILMISLIPVYPVSGTGTENSENISQEENTSETPSEADTSSEIANDKNTAVNEGDNAAVIKIESPSVLLMELNSGQVLYEKDPDTARRPASVTKIMTMLLAFEAIDSGKFGLEDTITVSEHAASMGGSQVYLEVGETQTVEDMLKCMIVSSANDAAVAVGEAIAGSEPGFVAMMNEKAAALGMTNTHFENACGLEADGHLMSARDIAILSRELLLKHPEVTNYSTIWMDTIIHKTRKGESEFGLANTNKFLKKYDGANGLKTGYTSAAGFSMSATATRNGTTLIAVVMGSKTKDIRYSDAAKLLDYGFANCTIYEDNKVLEGNNQIEIKNGVKKQVTVEAEQDFHYVFVGDSKNGDITKKMEIVKEAAPVEKGDIVAKVVYEQAGNPLGSVNIIAIEPVEQQKYHHALEKLFLQYINIY